MLIDIENKKEDSNKCYEAQRILKNRKPKKPLIVKNKNGEVAGTPKAQADITTTHFKKMLAPNEFEDKFKKYDPHDMTTPFTADEIQKAARSLKNNKSTGIDNIKAELIKYAPNTVHKLIADIYNETARSGNYPEELVAGILTPLQKPGKTKGPPENLRLIILLSILRKLLTISLLKRIWTRVKKKIPINQAAYQPGRSTTELVFAIKVLCEKAIASSDYTLYLLLLDMSKAFDTVRRDTLFERLEQILQPDELHLLSILTNRPTIRVRVNEEFGETFETYLGIMQGDCLSAILFIFYLAECFAENNENTAALKYDITNYNDKDFNVDPFYADDTTFAGTNQQGKKRLKQIEKKLPKQMEKKNLSANHTKTERYEFPIPPPPQTPNPSYETLIKHKNDKIIWSEFQQPRLEKMQTTGQFTGNRTRHRKKKNTCNR